MHWSLFIPKTTIIKARKLATLVGNPACLFILIWCGVPTLSYLVSVTGMLQFPILSPTCLAVIFLFNCAWLTGALAAKTISTAIVSKRKMRLPALSCALFVVTVMVVSFAYLSIRLLQISMVTGSVSIAPSNIELFRLRITEEGVPVPYSFIFIWNPIMFVLPVIVYYLHRQWRPLRLTQFASCFCFAILYAGFIYLSTSRSTAFVSLLVLFFVLMYKKAPVFVLMSIPLTICVSFFGLGALVGKGEFSSFGIYLLAPLHAFDVILNQNPLQYELLSFRPFQPILYQLGYLQNTFHLLDYLETPYPVNVYTVFGVYVHDYGVLATSIILVIVSFITYKMHLLALHTNSAKFETLAAFCLTFIVLGVFYDYYTSSLFTFLAPILIVALFPNRFGLKTLRQQSA